MNAVNPTSLLSVVVLTTALALSGCIEPDEVFAEWDQDQHDHDSHHDESDHWDDDCIMEPTEPVEGPAAADEEGEVSSYTVQTAYADADPRFHNHVDGEESSVRTIDVPIGADSLTVGLVYDLDGEYELRLRNPLGATIALERFDGEKEMQEDSWVVQDKPLPGSWRLTIDIEGRGGYTFGFYLDD